MFSHERLKVYDKTLTFAATLMEYSSSWDKRHSVVDRVLRAVMKQFLSIDAAVRENRLLCGLMLRRLSLG